MMESWLKIFISVGLILMVSKWLLPDRCKQYAETFKNVEKKYNLPDNLLARMAEKESACNPRAVSGAGAEGIMQIVPRWHPGVDTFNAEQSIEYAGKYMRENFDRYGSWRAALAAYNWGPGNVSRVLKFHGNDVNVMLADAGRVPLETRDYVKKISTDVGVA